MIYENIVIGGGASALMFVASLKSKKRTLILEHNDKLGAKILISGGGRCNFTNREISPKDYLANEEFIKPILKRYNNRWLLRYFTQRGLEYDIKNGREYFCKNSAKELLNILAKQILGAKVRLNQEVLSVSKVDNLFEVHTKDGIFKSKRVVVASGGLSFEKLGSSPIGYKVAESFGIQVNRLNPALVGFTLQKEQSFFKSLSGISIDCEVKVENRSFKMPILFAHKGISGPAILNASLFWSKGVITIDFLPDFSLKKIRDSKKSIVNILPLPQRFIKAFLSEIGLKNIPINQLTKEQWQSLQSLKNYTFAPAGTFGYSKAEVTKGGVSVDEIDNKTMQVKKVDNLFFIGEVLDVTGRLGGFNFQWAFSSARVCAELVGSG